MSSRIFSDTADRAYERIRRDSTDVAKIAKHTGYRPKNIQRVKEHLFINQHLLDRYSYLGFPSEWARFDSDLGIAFAWERLTLGTFTAGDLDLLRHETAEAWYMRNVAPGYSEAHNRAQKRFPYNG